MKVEYVICTFTLCFDVLEGVLQFGTRRSLSKLECIGRRFHCVIANRFVERPLLILHRIQTVFNEEIWKTNKEAFESGSGFDKAEAILNAPDVRDSYDKLVSKISFLIKLRHPLQTTVIEGRMGNAMQIWQGIWNYEKILARGMKICGNKPKAQFFRLWCLSGMKDTSLNAHFVVPNLQRPLIVSSAAASAKKFKELMGKLQFNRP